MKYICKFNVESYGYIDTKNESVTLEKDKIFPPLPKEYKSDRLIMRFYFGFERMDFLLKFLLLYYSSFAFISWPY